jgi:hypothetical protein
MNTPSLTQSQLQEIRALVDEAGFLPMTNKAERLFIAAGCVAGSADEVRSLREAYDSIGYLSRSKAARLIELASVSIR